MQYSDKQKTLRLQIQKESLEDQSHILKKISSREKYQDFIKCTLS